MLHEHQELCYKNKTQLLELPAESSFTHFKNHFKKFGHPIIGFADFEAVLLPEDRSKSDCQNCKNGGPMRECDHATHVINKHHPVCFSLVFIDVQNRILYTKNVASKDNVMPQFFQALEEAKRL